MKARDFITQEVQRQCKAKVINPANLEWSSPVVFVAMKDGSLQMCVDYQNLVAVMLRDTHSFQR